MKILLLGCGNIGKALLSAWNGEEVLVVQPSMSCAAEFPQAQFVSDLDEAAKLDFQPDVTVCAVKPQVFNRSVDYLARHIRNSLLVSVMAGVKIKRLEFGNNRVVRIMPNIAIKVGHSVNLSVAGKNVTPNDVEAIDAVLRRAGLTVWLKNEEELDRLTSIFGSGPAYVFMLMEMLIAETVSCGIDEKRAKAMARELLAGSAMIEGDFRQLRESVTSKGGCTEVALSILQPGVRKSLNEALRASLTRLGELDENRN